MDRRTKVVICAAAAYVLLSMMALIIESRKRKRAASRTGGYASDTEDDETENEGGSTDGSTQDNQGATSSASKSNKRARIAETEEEGLIAAFISVGDKLAKAIEKLGSRDNDVPEDLFDNLNSLPGVSTAHKCSYFTFLVANPHIGRAFNKLPSEHKLNWVNLFISGKFPGQ